jgi:hypothetical protein
MAIPGYFVHRGVGAIMALVSLPLILRLVPMNHFYGIRIPKAFESDRNWYDINAYGGWLLFLYGILLFAWGFLGQDFAPPATSPWTVAYVVGPLLLVFPLLVIIIAYARRLP